MGIKTLLITQARCGSTRLPGKILKEVNGKTLLQVHLERLNKCSNVDEIIVATTVNQEDEIIYNKALEWGFKSYRGSELNVLDRFYQSLKDKNADWVVRVTSDCPLLDSKLVDAIIEFAQNSVYDYVSNGIVEHYPDGQDVEVFKFSALKKAWENASVNSDLEHVTPYIRKNSNGRGNNMFSSINYACPDNYSHIRMTVDELEDFYLIQKLIGQLGTDKSWLDYTNHIIQNDLAKINGKIVRNEGYKKSLKNDVNG
jgi:spore coat polysaccharide biosynthesis protein SpsF (cytidylyltransferase family)